MYNHVLVGTDGSVTASRAVESAARLAHAHQARLTIAHAFTAKGHVGPDPMGLPDEIGWLRTPGGSADALVSSAVDLAQEATCGALEIEGRAELGTPRAVLRSLIDELAPDAVVVGNADARRSITRRGLGSALARRATTDVIIVDTSDASSARRAPGTAA
jgi:nucleotide-binding universal stress UspA family protein